MPLQPLPIATEHFSRVAIHLVRPLSPSSSLGHWYILTLINLATGFPVAVPKDTISVIEAFWAIFSRVGIPKEILWDRNTHFTSQLMADLHRLFGVKSQWERQS